MTTTVCKLYLTGPYYNISTFGISKEKCFIYDQLKDEVIRHMVLQIEFFTHAKLDITICFTYSDIAYTCMDNGKRQRFIRIEDSATKVDISITEVNIVKNRNTRSVKCISSGYNNWIKDNMIDYIGCIPPYWDGFTDRKCTVEDLNKLSKSILIKQFLTYNTIIC